MSTVAWKGREMAADSLGLRGSLQRKTTKIHRVGEHVIGFSGGLSDCLHFVKWWQDREKPLEFRTYRNDDAPDIEAIVIGPDTAEIWTEYLQPTPIQEDFWAVGSGTMAALAAMHMGASPAEAVRVASQVDNGTAGEIQVVEW